MSQINRAVLQVDGTNFTLQGCSYGFRQDIDPETGRPIAGVRTYLISAFVFFNMDQNLHDEVLVNWAVQPDAQKDGSIILYENQTGQVSKEIRFTGGVLVRYNQVSTARPTSGGGGSVSLFIQITPHTPK
ncbi:MAG: hypothetical protein MUC97_09050 [Bernardetiaceae bacterium]|nr:hypothetical protein [Bernardetiaceae bacterium]